MASKKDKRIFKRFKCDSEIVFLLEDTTFEVKTTDYSLKGIGFSTEKKFQILNGSKIHFKSKDLNIEDTGKLIWTKELKSAIRGGIERDTISGDLKNYPFADIILDIKKSSKDGILTLKNLSTTKKIFINNGDMIFATSNKTDDKFIEVLLRIGKISIDQYYQILDTSKSTGKSHTTIILEQDILNSDEIIKAVQLNIEEIILDIFKWETGKFIFFEGPVIDKNIIKLNLSPANIIYRGIKRINNFFIIKNAIPSLDAILIYSEDPFYLFQNINLLPQDKEIFDLIDGQKTIKEILTLSPLNNLQTLKTLYALLSTRIINYKMKDSSYDSIHEEFLKEESIDIEFTRKVEDLYNRLNSDDYYNILGVEKWATYDEIKKSFYKVAKEYHPDKHFNLPTNDLKDKLNTIFSHITMAYKTLSNPETRIKYDRSLTNKSKTTYHDKKELAELRCKEGDKAYLKGDYKKAESLYAQSIYLDNSIPEYFYKLGLTLLNSRRYQEAGKYFTQAIKLEPDNSKYLTELGLTFIELGYNLRARSTLQKAINLNPANKRALEGLKRLDNLKTK